MLTLPTTVHLHRRFGRLTMLAAALALTVIVSGHVAAYEPTGVDESGPPSVTPAPLFDDPTYPGLLLRLKLRTPAGYNALVNA